jgi:hypothetical protein
MAAEKSNPTSTNTICNARWRIMMTSCTSLTELSPHYQPGHLVIGKAKDLAADSADKRR